MVLRKGSAARPKMSQAAASSHKARFGCAGMSSASGGLTAPVNLRNRPSPVRSPVHRPSYQSRASRRVIGTPSQSRPSHELPRLTQEQIVCRGGLGFREEGVFMKTGVAGAKAALASRAAVCGVARAAGPAWPCLRSPWPIPSGPPTGRTPHPTASVSPPAGGKVPTARSLASAVTGHGPGDVSVVCKGSEGSESLARLRRVAARSPDRRLPPAPQPAEDRLQRRAGRRSAAASTRRWPSSADITRCSRRSTPPATTIGS